MGEYTRDLAETLMLLFLIAVAMIAATVFLTFSTKRVLAKKERRGYHALTEARHFIKWVLIVLAIGLSINYWLDARNRTGEHKWHRSISDTYSGLYAADYCVTPNGKILLRLYRTTDWELLAERTYTHDEPWRLFWGKKDLIYDVSDPSENGGQITLPPTLMDRMLAKLP